MTERITQPHFRYEESRQLRGIPLPRHYLSILTLGELS